MNNEDLSESKKSKEERMVAAAQRMQDAKTISARNRQIQQARLAADVASKNELQSKRAAGMNRAVAAMQRQNKEGEAQTYWRDDEGNFRVGGSKFAASMAKNINLNKHDVPIQQQRLEVADKEILKGAQLAIARQLQDQEQVDESVKIKTLREYINNLSNNLILESKETEWGLKRTDAGKFHEVLTGGLINHYGEVYQANKSKGHEEAHRNASEAISNPPRSSNKKKTKVANIRHMEQFRDESANKSASEWHESLSSGLSQAHYDEHLAHATHAAKGIIGHLHEQGVKDLKKVHFTANSKDIERLTNGKDSSQKGNNSDIVVEHGHKDIGGGFSGVSLKSGEVSKAFNPGIGGISKVVDHYFSKITGKAGNFSNEANAADIAAQEDHHKIIKKHAAAISSVLGKSSIKAGKDNRPEIGEDALNLTRYAHEHLTGKSNRSKELRGLKDAHIKKIAAVYGELQESRLNNHKRAVTKSLNAHLSQIFSPEHDKKKGVKRMRAELISTLTNTPSREEGSMSIMRHNTVLKKGKRTSKIGYGLGESAKRTKKYTVKGGAGIGLEIAGTDGKNKTMSLKIHSDSSPSHGSGAGLRKSLHVTLGKTDDDSLNEGFINEEAPANAMGTAGISGADTAVNVGIAGRDMLLNPGVLRRPPPKMFGGKRVFTVPSNDYYKATLGRKKGQHWRSMVNGSLGEEIRQYALENKNAPIIVEDETTGAMMYLRYGKR